MPISNAQKRQPSLEPDFQDLSKMSAKLHLTSIDGQYRYLAGVYQIYCCWKCDKRSEREAKALRHKFSIVNRGSLHPIRVIIESTMASATVKQKSRWTRALQFAVLQGVQPAALVSFLSRKGGIAGCARNSAQYNPRRRARRDDWDETE